MASKTLFLNDELYDYLRDVSVREPEIMAELRQETGQLPLAVMQITPEQGQFMHLLTKILGVRQAIEIGVFTGYSSMAIAQALPSDGCLIACDVSAEWTAIGKRFWQRAGLEHKIDLRLAPAMETLEGLLSEGREGQFDFAFIDADKQNYTRYYECCLRLLRPGGVIMVDNVFWGGSVINPENQDAETQAIRAFNNFLKSDERVDISLVPIGDGLTLARKKV